MEEYRAWLESVIAEERIAVQGGADDSKLKACEECLKKVVQLEDSGVDFYNLEIGKRYVSVFEDGTLSDAFVVLDKGCDCKGRYILYTITSPINTLKGYESEYIAVKYFREVK